MRSSLRSLLCYRIPQSLRSPFVPMRTCAARYARCSATASLSPSDPHSCPPLPLECVRARSSLPLVGGRARPLGLPRALQARPCPLRAPFPAPFGRGSPRARPRPLRASPFRARCFGRAAGAPLPLAPRAVARGCCPSPPSPLPAFPSRPPPVPVPSASQLAT